ncbi:ATP-binding cassette domain-containing protein [Salipiger sp. P9]|uniref:ABC transporter ATP-binding protein n=1 Tax=Salipiger pentaromativorans TaxID=2943193 RepID=UPI0021570B2B|nr:oligopeptide/dipeptide ABC transporter ATP-binding protein [Salipiger pentaromativorans]MCR8549236.1 ATP-binding cassette domain-containing protein [Salipiger pentaromativorans]
MSHHLLELENVTRQFQVSAGLSRGRGGAVVRAVDNVSLTLEKGETLGLVGESGCGKSTLARLALKLLDPDAGTIRYNGQDITDRSRSTMRPLRRRMQMIFQDPSASLNPRMTVGELIEEPLIVHEIGNRASRRARVSELLSLVGLSDYHASRQPHQFSGGQRQRIGIARALAVNPELIVCDEPVSALDVSIQAQIVNLMQDLQTGLGLSYLFIAHDLAVVKHIADRIAVMYLGKIMEIGPADRLFENPRHPYTRTLIASVLSPDGKRRQAAPATGDLPSPLAVPEGCRFHPRCPHATDLCRRLDPALQELGEGHQSACHHAASLPTIAPPEAKRQQPTPAERRMGLAIQARS